MEQKFWQLAKLLYNGRLLVAAMQPIF